MPARVAPELPHISRKTFAICKLKTRLQKKNATRLFWGLHLAGYTAMVLVSAAIRWFNSFFAHSFSVLFKEFFGFGVIVIFPLCGSCVACGGHTSVFIVTVGRWRGYVYHITRWGLGLRAWRAALPKVSAALLVLRPWASCWQVGLLGSRSGW